MTAPALRGGAATAEPLERARGHVFVVPDLDGPETGGTLYNARLIAALRARGVACHALAIDVAKVPGALAHAEQVWVDSLYLAELPVLEARAPRLVLHYLPSQVAHARMLEWDELCAVERAALERAAGFLVPSRFMAQQLARLPLHDRSVLCVEPGVELPEAAAAGRTDRELNALMLCNVTEGKGVLEFLQALGALARDADRFRLAIAGSLAAEPAYAQACARSIDAQPCLRARVVLCGALRHRDALVRLQQSDVLVSASRMEAYGMALAEARAAGVPIIARAAGHASALVTAERGGALVASAREVAAELLALTRDPARLRAARARATAARLVRSWHDAAAEFCAQNNG
jgi:glycosyltransferase involved in cell wall biosynthesis